MDKLKQIIYYFYLRFKSKNEIERKLIPLKKAQTIGLFFESEDTQHNNIIVKFSEYLIAQDKEVQLLGYVPTKEIQKQYPFPYFNKKDTTWYEKPNSNKSDSFIKTPFDLIINFTIKDSLPLEYIAASSSAKYRVGFNKEENNPNYDLILIPKENHDISTLISNLEKYLK